MSSRRRYTLGDPTAESPIQSRNGSTLRVSYYDTEYVGQAQTSLVRFRVLQKDRHPSHPPARPPSLPPSLTEAISVGARCRGFWHPSHSESLRNWKNQEAWQLVPDSDSDMASESFRVALGTTNGGARSRKGRSLRPFARLAVSGSKNECKKNIGNQRKRLKRSVSEASGTFPLSFVVSWQRNRIWR